jgi:ATP-dependent DNA ligase
MRVFLFKSGENVVLANKNGGIYTPAANPRVFAEMTEFSHAPHRMILDGEYLSGGSLHIFDVIQVDNRDLRALRLEERREILSEIIDGMNIGCANTLSQNCDEIEKFADECVANGYRGTICKGRGSKYGEQDAWLELERRDTICCFVVETSNERGAWRWTLAAIDSAKNSIVDLGLVSDFAPKIKPNKIMVGSVVEVKYKQFSEERKLVQPLIVRIRHDKPSSECVLL